MSPATSAHCDLPCVIQVGFSGTRKPFDFPDNAPASLVLAWERELLAFITRELEGLKDRLPLPSNCFLCGISQIAIGGDFFFTRACQALRIPQRIFLPQTSDLFLAATGSSGESDFTLEQRTTARELLSSPHIVEVRVVSQSNDRQARFRDVNREICKASDVVVCLLREENQHRPGGANELLEAARSKGKPVLEIRVGRDGERPRMTASWHLTSPFQPPHLPAALAGMATGDLCEPGHWPNVEQFCGMVKSHVSREAQRQSKRFANAALIIIGAHILATFCSTVGLVVHGWPHEQHEASENHTEPSLVLAIAISGLLLVEFVALLFGWTTHYRLHHGHHSKLWALSRLLAEINRSVHALGKLRIYPDYLFRLRLPAELQPLLRTLSILHLHSTSPTPVENLPELRANYIANRLLDQTTYYQRRRAAARRGLRWANTAFTLFSGLALVATFAELLVATVLHHWLQRQIGENLLEILMLVFGGCAIFLPVAAVGALSGASAMDWEARAETFYEMSKFLDVQKAQLELTESISEFQEVVQETEAGLLGETATWYSRRSFTGVS